MSSLFWFLFFSTFIYLSLPEWHKDKKGRRKRDGKDGIVPEHDKGKILYLKSLFDFCRARTSTTVATNTQSSALSRTQTTVSYFLFSFLSLASSFFFSIFLSLLPCQILHLFYFHIAVLFSSSSSSNIYIDSIMDGEGEE